MRQMIGNRRQLSGSGAARNASPSLRRNSAIDMRFWVRVPVLSVHKTVAEPRVSMAAARRVSTRAREIRHAPIAMKR